MATGELQIVEDKCILANELRALIHQCPLFLVARCRYRQLAWPTYLYITCCPGEENYDKDGDGKGSCTERGLVNSGTGLLADLKCQEFSGKHKKITRMAPADFELLIKLVITKIVKIPDCEQLLQFKFYSHQLTHFFI